MSERRVKNAVMLTVLVIWSAFMTSYLVRLIPPEPALWGVPGGIWLALNPPQIGGRAKTPQESEK